MIRILVLSIGLLLPAPTTAAVTCFEGSPWAFQVSEFGAEVWLIPVDDLIKQLARDPRYPSEVVQVGAILGRVTGLGVVYGLDKDTCRVSNSPVVWLSYARGREIWGRSVQTPEAGVREADEDHGRPSSGEDFAERHEVRRRDGVGGP